MHNVTDRQTDEQTERGSTGCTTNTAPYDWRPSFRGSHNKTWNSLSSEVTSSRTLQAVA